MTNESAIKELKQMLMDNSNTGAMYNALKLAIEALTHFNSNSNSIKNELNELNDTISRQDAIDAIEMFDMNTVDGITASSVLKQIRSDLEHLPSAQPEPCEDAVSRHRLLSDLKELIVAWEKYPVMAEQIKGVEAAIGYVELIPSAQPERKTGRWIFPFGDKKYKRCSVCGRTYYSIPHNSNFCPNCGSYNGGKNEV